MRQTGEFPPGFEPINCPPEVLYIWDIWCALNRRRQEGNAVSYSDIVSWSELSRVNVLPFEMSILDQIEDIFFKKRNKRIAAQINKVRMKDGRSS